MGMKHIASKAAIAVLVMGTSIVGMAGITYAGAARISTISPPPSTMISGKTWYQVSTAGELEYIDMHQSSYLTANIELMNNIDLTGYSWVPLGSGNYDSSTKSYIAFAGTFNGQGFGVSNLNVNATSTFVGFFGAASGIIENLHVGGAVTGFFITGGLVGDQTGGSITDSYATVSVVGQLLASGGLVGEQHGGSIADSYATGQVRTADYLGGLVGWQRGGSITDSYATGKVNSSGSSVALGGLVGNQNAGNITDSYFDPVTSGQSSGIGHASGSGTPIAISGDKWNVASTFVGWDFTHTWGVNPGINMGYPYLQVFQLNGGGLNGQLPEVPWAGGLPLLGLAGAGVLWFTRRRKGKQA